MAEGILRLFILVFCVLGISFLLRVGWWTVEPWVQSIPYVNTYTWFRPKVAVAVEPVGFIENGKLQNLHGAPAARALSHRLERINEALRRDMTAEYAVVQRTLNVTLPEASAPASTTFQPVISEPVSFDAKLFNVDVIGIGTFFYRQLHRGDSVRVLVEANGTKGRYFIEVQRPSGDKRMYVDRTVDGDLHEVLRRIACDTAFIYHRSAPRFGGVTEDIFCEFFDALALYQAFVIQTAAAAERGEPVAPAGLDRAIAAFEQPVLGRSQAPIIHVLRASLYKLRGDLEKAVATLQAAQQLAPGERFITDNLAQWEQELATRLAEAQKREAPPIPAAAGAVADAYAKVRSQPALAQLNYDDLLRQAASGDLKKVVVSVLSTGYTPGAEPPGGAEILPVENLVDGESGEDGNGHGTHVANLLAALAPSRAIKVMPVKVLSNTGSGAMSDILRGFDRSVLLGARIVVVPLGGGGQGQLLSEAVRVADARGTLIIAAAGNTADRPTSTGEVTYPAAAPEAVAVGSIDSKGGIARFSPGPDGVDVMAPGVDILTVDVDGGVRSFTGTSFSVTLAAAATALALAPKPDLPNEAVRAALRASQRALQPDGPGVLDAGLLWQKLSEQQVPEK